MGLAFMAPTSCVQQIVFGSHSIALLVFFGCLLVIVNLSSSLAFQHCPHTTLGPMEERGKGNLKVLLSQLEHDVDDLRNVSEALRIRQGSLPLR
jgi:hypothetical protein